jgi:hypothetical protein
VDVGNLFMRVNARIRPARTGNFDVMVEEFLKSFLEFPLNRTKIWLDLPPVEVRTVVRKSQLEVPHSIGYSM